MSTRWSHTRVSTGRAMWKTVAAIYSKAMKQGIAVGLLCLVYVNILPATSSATLPAPFDTAPFTTNCTGNCARRDSGGFFQSPSEGFTSLIYFIGTNITAGSLILDFAVPFGNGPGNDFAILTSSESWGPLADTALFEFFLDSTLMGSFSASLAPDRLFEFELPGDNIIANRIIITNITPDPPGINDLATMTFINAGVAHPISLTTVQIDIKPGSFPNSVNPRSQGVIPVAILTTDSFDAITVDPLSVEFGPNGATEAHGRGHIEDVNNDGKPDLLLHFSTQETGIQCGDTSASLTGQTLSGQEIEGTDAIITVGCK